MDEQPDRARDALDADRQRGGTRAHHDASRNAANHVSRTGFGVDFAFGLDFGFGFDFAFGIDFGFGFEDRKSTRLNSSHSS